MKKLLILGAGGFGRTIADVASQLGVYDSVAFLDDGRTGESILGKCAEVSRYADENTDVYPAFGNNDVRTQWILRLQQLGLCVATLVHPRAYVSPSVELEAGVAVLPMAVVNTGVRLESGCLINIGALVDHDCILGSGCHLAPGAIVKAENRIPAGMKIESGMVITNREFPL